jgi:hypothetical protein
MKRREKQSKENKTRTKGLKYEADVWKWERGAKQYEEKEGNNIRYKESQFRNFVVKLLRSNHLK